MTTSSTPQNYKATAHTDASIYAVPPAESESRFDKAYMISVRGILKLGCLVRCHLKWKQHKPLYFSYLALLHLFVWYQHRNVIQIMYFSRL